MSERNENRTPMAVTSLRLTDEPRGDAGWAVLVAASPQGAGRTVALTAAGLRIGREPGGEQPGLVLADGDASRNHATLTPMSDGVRLVDLGSTNGTLVHGRRVVDAVLPSGSVIRLGRTVLLVYQGDASATVASELGLVGRGRAMADLRRTIGLAARSTLPVLVIGETGAGKEVISQAIHTASDRRGELVTLNCGALPSTLMENALFGHKRGAYTDARSDEPGAFARADGGTLFLDEVGEMPLDAQPKLLRALETGEITPLGSTRSIRVAVRIVAATNRPLLEAVEDGVFREDLYARLAGVVLTPPPLRARREDILPLFMHFLAPSVRNTPMTADFVEGLLRYEWPRNVRELKQVAERLPVLNPGATAWDFRMFDEPMRRAIAGQADEGAETVESSVQWPPTRESLVELLRRAGGNVSRAAEAVGRNRKQVYRWMEKLGVEAGIGRE